MATLYCNDILRLQWLMQWLAVSQKYFGEQKVQYPYLSWHESAVLTLTLTLTLTLPRDLIHFAYTAVMTTLYCCHGNTIL